MNGIRLESHPIHLGPGASAEVEPAFTGTLDWYVKYAERHAGDGAAGRLVSMHTFATSWDHWEMHPHGAEVVLCLEGILTLHQAATEGEPTIIVLHAGELAINPPGTWHTADVDARATVLFITAGWGTQHRPR